MSAPRPAAVDVSLAERIQLTVARAAARLPDRVKIALAGGAPVIVDGQQLDPQLQFLRSAQRRRPMPGLLEPTIEEGRRRYRHVTQAFRGPITPVAGVRDLEIPGAGGPLQARHYTPSLSSRGVKAPRYESDGNRVPRDRSDSDAAGRDGPQGNTALPPLTVYFHGGGFVIGDLDTHDEPCRILCREAGVHVLSVAYRLAPEHPFPAAVDDAVAATAWARAHAASLGADPACVAVAGDSAGGNLAAVVAAVDPSTRPFARLLIYPATDSHTPRPSQRLFAQGFALTLRDRDEFFRHYLGGVEVRLDDPRLSPFAGVRLSREVPTVVVVAGFDVLRDEGNAYADALRRDDAPVQVLRFLSLEHGFIHLTGVCSTARHAISEIARAWRDVLYGVRRQPDLIDRVKPS
jgi:acetyl esterase